jgi:Glycosyl hydrolases family 28
MPVPSAMFFLSRHLRPSACAARWMLTLAAIGLADARSQPVALPAAGPAATIIGPVSPEKYGARLDGVINDRAALQQAIDAASAAGGGTVVVPASRTLLTGSIELRSHVTLLLEPGARIVASVEPADYDQRTLIRAVHAKDVAITGSGSIDGRGVAFMAREAPYIFIPKPWRPKLIVLEDCRDVRLSDFTIRYSASWTVHLAGCDGVEVRGLTILNNLKIPNCDGIDPDCSRNVRISECTIESGDDCIVLKTSRDYARYGPCENVVVRDCRLTTQDCALKIGTETVNAIRNVVFADCVVRNSHRGVGIWLRDAGSVENVFVHDIAVQSQLFEKTWWGASEPVFVSARARTPGGAIGRIRGLRFSRITAHGEGGVFVEGSPESMPEDLVFEGITEEITKTTAWPSRRDVRPPVAAGVQEAVVAGFHLRDARRVTLRNCTVRWGPNPPASYGPALDAERVEDLRVEGFQGLDAHPPPAAGNTGG